MKRKAGKQKPVIEIALNEAEVVLYKNPFGRAGIAELSGHVRGGYDQIAQATTKEEGPPGAYFSIYEGSHLLFRLFDENKSFFIKTRTKDTFDPEGRWINKMEKPSHEGTTEILEAVFPEFKIKYSRQSPLHSVDRKFLRKMFEKAWYSPTPDTLRRMYLKVFSPSEDVDLQVDAEPEEGRIYSDGTVHIVKELKAQGKFKKKIGKQSYVFHSDTTTGSIILRGYLDSLEPEITVVGSTVAIFEVGKDVGRDARRFLYETPIESVWNYYEINDEIRSPSSTEELQRVKPEDLRLLKFWHNGSEYDDQSFMRMIELLHEIGLKPVECPDGTYKLMKV